LRYLRHRIAIRARAQLAVIAVLRLLAENGSRDAVKTHPLIPGHIHRIRPVSVICTKQETPVPKHIGDLLRVKPAAYLVRPHRRQEQVFPCVID
jgi:hypothetical protein